MTNRREFIRCGVGLAGIIAAGKAPAVIVRSLVGAKEANAIDASSKNPYITDGLMAMWDGEWNAGHGIHDPDATTIANLVDANNYLTSGGTVSIGDNYFSADARTGWWTAQYSMSIPFPCTCETVFISNDFTDSAYHRGYVYCYSTGGGSKGRYFYWNGSSTAVNKDAAWVTGEGSVNQKVNGCYGLGGLQSYVGLFSIVYYDDQCNFEGRLNQVVKPTKYYGDFWPSSNVPCFFCRPPYRNTVKVTAKGNTQCGGRIYSVRIYNRALTDGEREHNYLVDKERFGLS